MPIVFIDNYPRNNLESKICLPNGKPLYGEIWIYQELQKFIENEQEHKNVLLVDGARQIFF